MADDKKQPIIIKRIKKGGHGHHGGAWKVAYADFVTAMMAFFLLMWLLSTAPTETLVGIADYFTPTVGVNDEKGIGFEGGASSAPDGTNKSDAATPANIKFGAPDTGPTVQNPEEQDEDIEKEKRLLLRVEQDLKEKVLNDPSLQEFKNNILVDQTPEGLRIQIVDSKDKTMFRAGSAQPEPDLRVILERIAQIIGRVPNYLSVAGHTDTAKGSIGTYGNWELSADRANASRRYLVSKGVNQDKFARVQGKAHVEPLKPESPNDPSNRRISMILLKKSALPEQLQNAPEKVFTDSPANSKDAKITQ